jgi:hypothetical protein
VLFARSHSATATDRELVVSNRIQANGSAGEIRSQPCWLTARRHRTGQILLGATFWLLLFFFGVVQNNSNAMPGMAH